MMSPPWYVLTGGPSSGKTAIWKELEKREYHMVKEAGRDVIETFEKIGISAERVRRDKTRFQFLVTYANLKFEWDTLPTDRPVILDRSIGDNWAYCLAHNIDELPELMGVARGRYRRVFFMEQLPFEKDNARTETPEDLERLNRLIPEVYRNAGYDVVNVPRFTPDKEESIKKRVELIVSHIDVEPVVNKI